MADDMEERVRQLEDQLRQALAQQLPIGVALPNKFYDGDIVIWLDSFDVCVRLRTTGTMMHAFAAYLRC